MCVCVCGHKDLTAVLFTRALKGLRVTQQIWKKYSKSSLVSFKELKLSYFGAREVC